MIINKLFLNGNHTKNPNNSLVMARNVRWDDDFENLINEDGFHKLYTFPQDICGLIPIDKAMVVFCTDGNGDDYIYLADEENAILYLKGSLQFSTDYPIKGVFAYNNLQELIVCFNDTHNDLRVFNFGTPYPNIDGNSKEFIGIEDGLNKLKLVPDYKVPTISLVIPSLLNTTGSLPKGVYQFTISYYIGNFDRLNWTVPSDVIYVGHSRLTNMYYNCYQKIGGNNYTTEFDFDEYYQTAGELNTNKSINLTIGNIDTNFAKYKLAVIYRTDTTTKVYDLGDFNTNVIRHDVKNLTNLELSLDEVTIPNVNYKNIQDITLSANRLTVLGVDTKGMVNYQSYANNIKVRYSTVNYYSMMGNTYVESLKIPVLDEVYALNIGLVGKDGLVKGNFHIPGRVAEMYAIYGGSVMENTPLTPVDKQSYQLITGGNMNETLKVEYYYQLYNTASPLTDPARKLGYWENQDEVYPTTTDFLVHDVDVNGNTVLLGDIFGQKVRHHKMPDMYKLFSVNDYPNKQLYLTFSDIKFPQSILDEIQGFFISFSNRNSANSTVYAYHPVIRNNFWKAYNDSTDDTSRDIMGTPNFTFSNSAVRFNDFSLLTNKPALSNLYLKSVYNTTKPTFIVHENVDDYVPILSFVHDIRDVTDYKYLPRDNSAADPSNKGREEALLLRVNTLHNDNNNRLVAELKSHTNNVFMPFYDQHVSIASEVQLIQDGVYSYTIDNVSHFDGYMSWYHNIMYRGDQSFEIDESGESLILTRHDGDEDGVATNAIKAYKALNISTVNTNLKTLAIEQVDSNLIDDRSGIENALSWIKDKAVFAGLPQLGLLGHWFGKDDEEYRIRSNIQVNPALASNISYAREYSFTNSIVPYYVYNSNNAFVNSHPYRVARTNVQSKESLGLGWRYFPALDYYEMPKHRGVGKAIIGQDNMLLIHMEHSLYVARYKDKLSTPTGSDAYIGTGDIFDRAPDELIPTLRGAAGIQSRFGYCVGEFGYMFADTYDQSIYGYSNQALDIITDDNVRNIFRKYMVASSGNPLTGNDTILGIDHANERIIMSNLSTNFTMSYCYHGTAKGWVGFHDYSPAILVNNRIGSYSVNRNNLKELYKFNTGDKGTYYDGVKYESYIDVLVNDNPKLDKVIHSVSLKSGLNNEANNIHKLFVYTRNQCSKIYDLEEFNSLSDYDKLRYLGGFWNYDLIRDYTNDPIIQSITDDFGNINPDSINLSKNWYELNEVSDRFIIVRLITNNTSDMVFRDLEYNISVNRR